MTMKLIFLLKDLLLRDSHLNFCGEEWGIVHEIVILFTKNVDFHLK